MEQGTRNDHVCSKKVAALLAFFLGGIGIHKLYLDRPGQAFVYFLFCWSFVPVALGVLECLLYTSMSEESFQRRYRTR